MTLHPFPHPKPRREPTAHICIPRYGPKHDRCWCGDVVVSLRDARQAAEPVRPCDSEPPAGDAA